MGVIENLIPVGSSRFPHDLGLWTSEYAISRSSTESFVAGIQSISVTADNSGTASVVLPNIDVGEAYLGKVVRAFAWMYLKSSSPCTIYLTTVVGSASATVQTTENLRGLEWSLVSVESDALSNTLSSRAYVEIEVTGLSSGEEFFMALPALTIPEMVLTSVSCDETYLRLPDYMRRADLEQSEPTLPFRRFIDVLTTLANEIDTTWNLFYYLPPEENNGIPLRSYLTEPELADKATMNWLAMVMGTTLINPSTGFTSWGSLLGQSDSNEDGSTTWAELVAEVDGPDAGTTLEWGEIETFAPGFTGLSEYERWQVSSAAYGLRAGSVASIKAAALQAFPVADRSSKTITVTKDPSDAFHILVEVDTMDAGEIGTVVEYINPAMPAGFGLTVSVAA
jgi:hypothetical protein